MADEIEVHDGVTPILIFKILTNSSARLISVQYKMDRIKCRHSDQRDQL